MELSLYYFSIVLELSPQKFLMLLLLIALTLGTYLYMKRFRKERVLELGNFETLKEIHGHESMISPVVLAIKVVVVSLLFLTATDSLRLETSHPVTNTDFAFAIDTSHSMLAPDYEPSRIEYSKNILSDYIREIPGYSNISVIEYSNEARVIAAGKGKKQALRALDRVKVELSEPGTALAPAISAAVKTLSSSGQEKKLVLVTDGENTAEMNISEAVEEARKQNVRIEILALTPTQEIKQLYQDIEEQIDRDVEFEAGEVNVEKLRRIASSTGGEYYHIGSQGMLESAMEDIVTEERRLGLNSDFIILLFISLIVITEIGIYSKYGAI